jgi:integrase
MATRQRRGAAEKLTDKAIRAAKPREKAYKLADGKGLVLVVDPRGGRYWRYRYRFAGKEKQLSLGTYPDITLKRAREKLGDAREQLDKGIDPSAQRKLDKVAAAARGETFGSIADEYYAQHARARKLAGTTKVRDERILKKLKARLGDRPLTEIDTPEILATLRSIEQGSGGETAHRALGFASRIYEYAIATGKAERDASSGLGKAIAPVVPTNRPAVTNPKELGALLRAIDNYGGQPATMAALKLLPMLFTRPGELRQATWDEFDLDAAEWRIPAERMKQRHAHLVPLSRQAVAVLRELHTITGRDELTFPSLRPGRPLSENTLNVALRNIGYDGKQHVAHGFRSTASTLLHEMGFDSQVIELQLAHSDRNKVRATYNRAKRLPERKKMMQAWANYLDQLKSGARVSTLRSAQGRGNDAG